MTFALDRSAPSLPSSRVSRHARMVLHLSVMVLLLSGLLPTRGLAWNDHTLATFPALSKLEEVKSAPPAKVESFDAFVAAEAQGLEALLKSEEAWAVANIPNYPPRPEQVAFVASGPAESQRARFLNALRINPTIKLALYRQARPGESLEGQTQRPWQELHILKEVGRIATTPYVALQEGQEVAALDVVASAADEPDFGLDINIWTDSPGAFGPLYGMGTLPFGNPTLEYATQAPMHMGLFHEAPIVYKLATYVKRTFPEMRVRQFYALARYAFSRGHDYWGWRFTGWGLHYMQDLSQPYHASLLPGVSVGYMLWINALGIAGIKGPLKSAIQLVTNRHLALENYGYYATLSLVKAGKLDHPLMQGLQDGSRDALFGTFDAKYVRGSLTAHAKQQDRSTDKALEQNLPRKLISDPTYLFETTEPNINVLEVVEKGDAKRRARFEAVVADLMRDFGAHSRNFVRAVRAP